MAIERLLNEERPAAELVVEVLEQAGIEMAFGIPGGHAGHIWSALEHRQNSIRTVPVREELLGSVMAEVYGRLTRRPGVLIGQGPWVLGNGFLGTLEAKLSSSPMLLLTDFSDTPGLSLHAPYQSGTGDYGAWDARQAFRSVTKHVFEAHEPAEAVHATQLAVKHALSGQPGPVAVLYSGKAINGIVQPDNRPLLYATQPYLPYLRSGAEPASVERAADALAAATRPVIVAGNGVRIARAYAELQALAEFAGTPVVTTASGKGCFAETHPLALGVFGTFGTPAANACVSGADLVIIVGSKLSPSDTARENPALLDSSRQTLLQIDAEPRNASWCYPAEHVLIGDAAVVLEQIGGALRNRKSAREQGEAASRVERYRSEHGYFFTREESHKPTTPMSPRHAIAELQRMLPDNAIVTCDAGENRIFMTHYYQTKRAEAFLQAAGAGPMGYAIPSAIGAKLVHPERPVVAVCGDGGFSMTMNGLMTAVENDIPIVTVIFNNQLLGWSAHLRSSFGCELKAFDYAGIARGMGCLGLEVHEPDELAPALEKALGARTAAVLDVMVSTDIIFDDVVSPLAKTQDASRSRLQQR